MKKIILAFLILITMIGTCLAADMHAWDLPAASSLSGGDLFFGSQNNITKKISLSNIETALDLRYTPLTGGAPTFVTPAVDTNTTRAATTAFVMAQRGRDQALHSNGTCATAATISAANGPRQSITLTNGDTCALTFTQPTLGTMVITLKVIQSAISTYNGAISGCKWPGGAAPTITATTGAVDFISVFLDGSSAYCTVIGQAFQ